jgi:hypothetical protein
MEKVNRHLEKTWFIYFIVFECIIYFKYQEPKLLFFAPLLLPFAYLFFAFLINFFILLFAEKEIIEKIIFGIFYLVGMGTLLPFGKGLVILIFGN